MAHNIPATFQDAYRDYVACRQRARDEQRGFAPIDRIMLNQPLAQMVRQSVSSHVDLDDEDKLALVKVHDASHDIDLTTAELAITRWLVAAGNEHKLIIDSLDARPRSLRVTTATPEPTASDFEFDELEQSEEHASAELSMQAN